MIHEYLLSGGDNWISLAVTTSPSSGSPSTDKETSRYAVVHRARQQQASIGFGDEYLFDSLLSQWSVQAKSGGYTIRGVSTGKFLNYDGTTLRDGLKVIANDNERIWDINRDEHNHGFHAMGSCVMGSQNTEERVVDTTFQVVGLEGLRVADMSVCPVLTNNHTQINAYLIAERCAQAILGDHEK